MDDGSARGLARWVRRADPRRVAIVALLLSITAIALEIAYAVNGFVTETVVRLHP